LIAIDTDVLGIYHIFRQDTRYEVTASFMQESERSERGIPVFTLLELCGLIATARQSREAMTIFQEYLTSPSMILLYPPLEPDSIEKFWARQNAELLTRIGRGLRLGDAAILWTVEATHCEALITWNTKHYSGKTQLEVLTPETWLSGGSA
jgi:hypothetical protein